MQGKKGLKSPISNFACSASKGQVAVEFFIYVGFFLLVFVVTTTVFINEQAYELKEKELLFVKETAAQFADYVNFAISAGDGYKGTFSFPTKIFEGDYDVKFGKNGYIYINWTKENEGFDYVYATNSGDYEMAVGAGSCVQTEGGTGRVNVDESIGEFTLINDKGVIYINQTC
jgi:uncharacterized protein (UPF0333 family)